MSMKTLDDLLIACTRDDAGRHFTEWLGWERLEDLGLIVVNRPKHTATGIDYDQQYWSLEVTQAGIDIAQLDDRDSQENAIMTLCIERSEREWHDA